MSDLKSQIAFFPHCSGCYLMRDELDKIIYVGKAKDLNKRVSQYFQSNINSKTKALMRRVSTISYLTTPSEAEALLLENNLIKEHLPFFNIKLTDDKTYPYLVITADAHPRLILSKHITKPVKRIYGPFPYQQIAKNLLTVLNRIYPFRKCKTIPKKPCLYYELGECLAPCVKSGITYDSYIKELDRFFKNQTSNPLEDRFHKLIKSSSENLNYEHCLVLKNSLLKLQEISHQLVDFKKQENIDYISFDQTSDVVYLVIIKRRNGLIKDIYKKQIDYYLSADDALRQFLTLYYSFNLSCGKVITNEKLISFHPNFRLASNKKDEETLQNCEKLASEFKEQTLLREQIKSRDEQNVNSFFTEIFGYVPKRIDVLDIAHLFGTNTVGGVVVFDQFVVKKELFRYYKLSTGANDLLSLESLVRRRYENKNNLPDLILTDGGKNQVSAIRTVLCELGINTVVGGLKKNDHHRLTSFITPHLDEIPLPVNQTIYKVLLNLDETCHQFAIRKYRELKIKDTTLTKLHQVKGIGNKTIIKLLSKFNSYEEILLAETRELTKLGIRQNQIEIIRRELVAFVKNN